MELFELISSDTDYHYLVFFPKNPGIFRNKAVVNLSNTEGDFSVSIKRLDLSTPDARINAFTEHGFIYFNTHGFGFN